MPGIRGCLSAMLKVLGHVGVLLSYIAGTYLNWRQSALLVAIAPSMLFLGTLFIPETPSYLVLNGKDDEAANSLQWLRGDHVDIRHELQVTFSNSRATIRLRAGGFDSTRNDRSIVSTGDQNEHSRVTGQAVRAHVQEQRVHASFVQAHRHHVRADVLPEVFRRERVQLLRGDHIQADPGWHESSRSYHRDWLRPIIGFSVIRYDRQ